ncbi:unnamed protein product, partial [Rotaria sp. Silwood1]
VVASVEDPLDNIAVQTFSTRISSARQANILSNVTTIPMITVSTTLEFDGQLSYQESNIYGLVTLKAPSISWPSEEDLSSISRVPIDLICVVDQSKSMTGNKMTLLKQTLIYIVEQLNEMDRLAIISFDRRAFDRSHGLKRMNQQNQERIKRAINDDMQVGSGTFIGCGLKMGIDLFTSRQTRNPLSALLLLTDGEDNRKHDYSQLMERLPEEIPCHTFGYGRKHETALLVQLAEQGNGVRIILGHVSVTYIEPNSGNTLTTTPVPFHLVRDSSLSFKQLQVNYALDIQRNRVETAFVLRRAMNENNYRRSLHLLKAQVKKIQESVSAQDPFCQQLIKDLKHRYPSERDYRLSQSNAFIQHSSERSTYAPESTPSVLLYQSPQQRLEIIRFNEKYT